MGSIAIRNLDPALKERFRIRAAENGHSMEAEVRNILQTTLKGPEPGRGSFHDLHQPS
jgi:plasmid stability protein